MMNIRSPNGKMIQPSWMDSPKPIEDIVKTKPIYSKKTFLWEMESIEKVMTDGVQRAIYCEFEVTGEEKNLGSGSIWKLTLDVVDLEPAITVEKVSPIDKPVYFRLALVAMKSPTEESDIISFPNTKLFYEGFPRGGRPKETTELSTFPLHKQLDYGASHTVWFKEVLNGDNLILRVDFETVESLSY